MLSQNVSEMFSPPQSKLWQQSSVIKHKLSNVRKEESSGSILRHRACVSLVMATVQRNRNFSHSQTQLTKCSFSSWENPERFQQTYRPRRLIQCKLVFNLFIMITRDKIQAIVCHRHLQLSCEASASRGGLLTATRGKRTEKQNENLSWFRVVACMWRKWILQVLGTENEIYFTSFFRKNVFVFNLVCQKSSI